DLPVVKPGGAIIEFYNNGAADEATDQGDCDLTLEWPSYP
ncbi:hypothetical protein Tco_0074905, partial [Tanacetum coccineum]